MKDPILLITNSCPYYGEAFLKNELSYIPSDQPVLLFPLFPGPQPPEDWDKPHIRVIPALANGTDKLLALGHGLTAPFRQGELKEIFRKPHPARNFLKALKFAWTADSRARAIHRWLKAHPVDRPILYSYWFYESAYAAARLRRHLPGSRFVSRCHGYDLYELRHPGGYLPFRPYLTKEVDTLCPISQDGVDYIKERYPHCGLRLSRLGTADRGLCQAEKDGTVTVVSCSNLVDVKRIGLLIRGLALCEKPVRWYHFGDGPLKDALLAQAAGLPRHIQWQFMGSLPNDQILDFYRTHYIDAFLNVSSSEGIPVSIMEALSFGIPAIATDVGGTHEILIDGCNGLLLPSAPEPSAIASAIFHVAQAPAFREAARRIWLERCNAATHYHSFYEMLQLGANHE